MQHYAEWHQVDNSDRMWVFIDRQGILLCSLFIAGHEHFQHGILLNVLYRMVVRYHCEVVPIYLSR